MFDTDQIVWIAFMVAWIVLPSFFWLRGVWRNTASDRVIAGVTFAIFAVLAIAIDGTTYALNGAGVALIAMGIITMVLGPMGKEMPHRRSRDYGILCIVLGLFLALLL